MKPLEFATTHILRRVHQMATGRRNTPEWLEAWEHIKDHLSTAAGAGKPTHTVFRPQFRSIEAVAELVAQTTAKPSDTEASFLTGPGGGTSGAPCLLIRRWFNAPIGDGGDGPITTLWVIARDDGRLITAYPRHHPNAKLR